jgi:hypothetical protein
MTAGPIGMGTAYVVFLPGQMTFEEYFSLEGLPVEQQYVNFLLGLVPKALHLVDPYRVDLPGKRGPSTGMACQLCAGVMGTEALKILLGRGAGRVSVGQLPPRLRHGRERAGDLGPASAAGPALVRGERPPAAELPA